MGVGAFVTGLSQISSFFSLIKSKNFLDKFLKTSTLGFGKAINKWFSFDSIKVFNTVTLPMGVNSLSIH